MSKKLSQEVEQLASVATMLQSDYQDDIDIWNGSPFAWIKAVGSSRTRGKIGEQIVSGWLATKSFNIARSPDSDADRLVETKRVEIKFSTLWKSGIYKFQQIRDQDYDLLICLGVSPFDASCWVFSKKEIMRYWTDPLIKDIVGQHEGASGAVAWLTIRPSAPSVWLSKHGGALSDAIEVLGTKTGYAGPKSNKT